MNKQQLFKTIQKVFTPKSMSEGVGAKVKRVIGTSDLPRLDPFLVLDHFSVKLPGGFPDHPHRGFETVTYMLEGQVQHQDFKGNKGTLNPGDLQWMTAGKGILHAEMPTSFEQESIGFQLWINLASKDKFVEPQYQEISKEKVPVVTKDKVTVKLIAGESLGNKGPIYARTPALYLDVEMEPNTTFEQVIPKGWNAFGYVYKGEALFTEKKEKVGTDTAVIFKKDENEVLVVETKEHGAKFILIGGLPMNEPIVHYGPFVLNNEEELDQTLDDFQSGQNGFENAPGWRSEIRNLAHKKN